MKYLNQLEYRHIPYITHTKDDHIIDKVYNVARSGCGLCAVCMMVELLTDKTLPIEECVKLSEGCGANYGAGTDMTMLGPVVAEKYGLSYRESCELDEVIAHLQNGGQVVALVGIPEGQKIGLFTKGGHYISLIATDGKEFCILDPSYTPDKFDIPERAGKVNTSHAPFLYCNVHTVHAETKKDRIKYYLFSRKKA